MLIHNPSALGQPLQQCGPILTSLGWSQNLSVNDLSLALSVDGIAVVQGHTLTMSDLTLATRTRHGLVVDALDVGVSIDTVALGVALEVDDLAIATSIDAIGMNSELNVSDLTLATSLDGPVLIPDIPLDVSDLSVGLSIDSIASGAVTGAVVVTFQGYRPEVGWTAI